MIQVDGFGGFGATPFLPGILGRAVGRKAKKVKGKAKKKGMGILGRLFAKKKATKSKKGSFLTRKPTRKAAPGSKGRGPFARTAKVKASPFQANVAGDPDESDDSFRLPSIDISTMVIR